MFKYIDDFVKNYFKKPTLKLEDFNEITIIINDDWNKVEKGNVWKCYFEKSVKLNDLNIDSVKDRKGAENIAFRSIGYISYKIKTGQIGLFFIDPKFRNLGLGKQILTRVINDIKTNQNKSKQTLTVWAVTTKDHPFWSNVYDKSFEYKSKPHSSVKGSGYVLNFDKYEKLTTKN